MRRVTIGCFSLLAGILLFNSPLSAVEVGSQIVGDSLSPQSGDVDFTITVPDPWPSREDQTLFHIGEETHTHVTLFFRDGVLNAVYKSDIAHHVGLRHDEAKSWKPGERRRVQFSWTEEGDGVRLMLQIDGELVGMSENTRIVDWPDTYYIGKRGPTRNPWLGGIESVDIQGKPALPKALTPGHRTVTVHADDTVGECYNFWSISNTTSQYQFADPDYCKTIARTRPFTKYIQCVRLIGGRNDGKQCFFLGLDENGEPRYDFALLKTYLRGIVNCGYTPRIVLDNVPTAMSEPGEMHTYGNTKPPLDYELYHDYIENIAKVMVEEFGLETVTSWRIRVMTEPDLDPGHWEGTKEEWLRLYDTAVDAVLRVVPDADIGPGNILDPSRPHTKLKKQWGLEIIDHAATGRNYYTGKTGTRLRYFSCSWYGRVGRSIENFDVAINKMRKRLDKYPQYRGLPIEIAEFCVLNDERGKRLWGNDASEWGGSFIASIANRAWRLNVAQIHQWSVSCAGMPTPYTHVLTMLEKMVGGQRLRVETKAESEADCSAVACRQGDRLLVMVYNHRAPRSPKINEGVTLNVRDKRMKKGAEWRVSEWLTDKDHGSYIRRLYEDCEKAGLEVLPQAPMFGGTPARRFGPGVNTVLAANNVDYKQVSAMPQTRDGDVIKTGNGSVALELDMTGHSVRLLELVSE